MLISVLFHFVPVECTDEDIHFSPTEVESGVHNKHSTIEALFTSILQEDQNVSPQISGVMKTECFISETT